MMELPKSQEVAVAAEKEPRIPTEQDAARILEESLHLHAVEVTRFPTGLANYVYDVVTDDEKKLVVRLARPDLKGFFEGALNWYAPLAERNVPLPALHYSELDENIHGFPVMIMDRLPGVDLGEVYSELTSDEKYDIADGIIDLQQEVSTMQEGSGYGYARINDDPELLPAWTDVLRANIERSRNRFSEAGIISPDVLNQLERVIEKSNLYFESVRPTCFLDDTTTKNVLVDQGELSGIVDVDSVAYGDPLYTLALTRMALLSSQEDTKYTDYWAEKLRLSPEQEKAVSAYTAIFCADFLSETGHRFNKDQPEPINQERVSRLTALLKDLCKRSIG